MNPKIIKLCKGLYDIAKGLSKGLYDIAKGVIQLIGWLMLFILCAYSISYLEGNSIDDATISLKSFITPELVYIYLGVLIVSVIGLFISLGIEIKNGIKKAKDPKLSAEEKGRSLFKWLMK